MRLKILLFFALNFLLATAFANEKLIFAIDIIRHGNRTPINTIPTLNSHWPDGLGQLTPKGMRQEYELGMHLRKTYINYYHLLPNHFLPDSMYVRSTDLDRTLMSAQSFLLGLYPPGTGPNLPVLNNAALPHHFQPVPIHAVPKNQDNLLLVNTTTPEFKALLERYVNSTSDWKQKTQILQAKFAAWSKATGLTISNLYQVMSLSDTLYINQLYHLPLPNGLTPKDAEEIINTGSWAFIKMFQPIEIGKSSSLRLLKDIIDHLQNASHEKSLKYILYSAHDSTLLSLMSAMGTPLNEVPPYASDLNFSLFDKGHENYYVKISFNNKTVVPPGCKEVCTLSQFVALLNKK